MGVGIELSKKTRLAVPACVLSRRAGNETVLLNLDSEEYFGLEQVGARLWELVEQGVTFGEVLTNLQGEYEITPTVLEADLRSILADLAASGLVLFDGP